MSKAEVKPNAKPKKQLILNPIPKNLVVKTNSAMSDKALNKNLVSNENHTVRDVSALPVEYTDLNKASNHEKFSFKAQILPITAILVFSLILVGFLQLSKKPSVTTGAGVDSIGPSRSISGDLNDLSSGVYTQENADYESEKVCVDQPDGKQSCTTKTKLKRSFR